VFEDFFRRFFIDAYLPKCRNNAVFSKNEE
jgi:hypothetical protein